MGAAPPRRSSSAAQLSNPPAQTIITDQQEVQPLSLSAPPIPPMKSSPRECSILARRTSFRHERGQHKVIALGNAGVGKTSLLYRLATNLYVDAAQPQFEAIEVLCPEKPGHKLVLLDTADQEQFRKLTGSYYRGVELCLIVVDVSNGESYFDADLWLKDLDRYLGKRTRRVLLVATKCDVKNRIVDTDALKEWSKKHRIAYYEVSSLTGDGCPQLLDAAIDIVFSSSSSRKSPGVPEATLSTSL